MAKYLRVQQRSVEVEVEASAEALLKTHHQADLEDTCTVSVGTDISMVDINRIICEIEELRRKGTSIEEQLTQTHDIFSSSPSHFILNNNHHTHFYTGLPSSSVFFTLLTYLTTAWHASWSVLTLQDQFLIVLMKLRLDLTHK